MPSVGPGKTTLVVAAVAHVAASANSKPGRSNPPFQLLGIRAVFVHYAKTLAAYRLANTKIQCGLSNLRKPYFNYKYFCTRHILKLVFNYDQNL